jgi:hypothetical protein
MKSKWFVLLVCIVLVASLGGCQLTKSGQVTRGGQPVYPDCDPAYMVSPSLVSPLAGGTISSLQPNFEWAYPGYYIANGPQQQGQFKCKTAGFHVYLSSGPFFQDDLGGQAGGVPGFDTLYTVLWHPGTPLEPGREYRWSLRPISQGVEGPVSEVRYFYTGPACTAGALVAPISLSPLNNWVVKDSGDLSLKWWYPDSCLPDSYSIELATTLVFDGSPLNGATGNSSTSWSPSQPLTDCTRYYWRVRAFKDNQDGQYSQVYTFRVEESDSCPAEMYGMIQGTVWEDQCASPGAGTPMPNQPPLGCVYPSPGTIFTNQTYDPGEPGIPGLVVLLGQGACPSTGYRAISTGPDGTFNFYFILAGTYCVNVDSQDSFNNPILIPGTWTNPNTAIGNALASQTITISAGQDVKNMNFGWWYHFGSGWGSPNATVFGEVWHDLCPYTPGDPVPNPLSSGCILDQWGNVHADAVRQADEPGIPGVVVDIGPGDCPSAGLATAVTDANGYYHFVDLPAGKYCLRIDSAHNPTNAAILLPGSWTVVPGGHEGMTFRAITLTAATTLFGQDFGWDYDNLPQVGTPTPVPAAQPPNFTLTINANCRLGPDKKYDVITSAPAGQSYPIVGRDIDGNWYYVQLMQAVRCWFAKNVGTTNGDVSGLQVFYGPLLPTDTPVLACSARKDKASCIADPACTWANTVSGPGACKSK